MNVHVLQVSIAALIGITLTLTAWRYERRARAKLQAELSAARHAQQTQTNLLSQRVSLDSLKDDFIATVSHELRTPLTSIHAALRLLAASLTGSIDPKSDNLLRIAVTNTDRLIRLTNDILDLQRMDSGRVPLNLRRCSLRDLAEQATETMGTLAEAAQISLLVAGLDRTHPDLAYFDGDPDCILQVLTNLLSNAIKFSAAGSVVTTHIGATPSSVTVRVEDEGRGIPESERDQIFEKFHQTQIADLHAKGGTGLGLAICRTLVLQHHGSIRVEDNASGRGASFVVDLPRSSRVTDSPAVKPQLVGSSMNATVLLCDDDLSFRITVAEQLRSKGCAVLQAESGEVALDITATRAVDLILLDLQLPGISGWEVLRRLNSDATLSKIPVIVLSALPRHSATPMRRMLGQDLAAKVQGWLQKPFEESVLLSEVANVLQAADVSAQVLLVEQDSTLAKAMLAGLRDAHVQVQHATTREEAMAHCSEVTPDLLILDLGLPDGDGFSLVRWLRHQPALRGLPLVVYSGREVSESEKAQLRLGPTKFLTKKTIGPRELDECALSLMRQSRGTLAEETLSA